jgi:hypothetical protein
MIVRLKDNLIVITAETLGHSDAGVHKKYTHTELQVLRDAVARLPSIAGPA